MIGVHNRETSSVDVTVAGRSLTVNRFGNVLMCCTLITLLVVATNAIWFAFDKRVPSTDEAGHILNGLQYKELFRHFHFWRPSWIHDFLSVNPFYPPGVYIYDGILKTALGNARWVDNVCFLSYIAVLTASTYGISWCITRSIFAASMAALLVNLYPQVAWLSHVYMLDLPLTAMVAAGLFALIWWRENPTWKRTALAGIVVAAACFTKQLGAAFLIPPCLYLLVVCANQRLKLVAIGSIVSAVLLPWLFLNIDWIRKYAAENAANMQGANTAPWVVFTDYIVGLGYSMSFILTVGFLVALGRVQKNQHRKNAILYVFAIGGLAMTSLLSCTFPLDRYAASALIVCAVVTACGITEMGVLPRWIAAGGLLSVGLLQYISFSFAPYPLSDPRVTATSQILGVQLREFRGARVPKSTPNNAEAWGQQWVVDTISARDPQAPVWLNILPSQGLYNPHSFELLARECGSPMRPTTSRRWTIAGDTVSFSPQTALYYHWYLLTSGDQGNQFRDEASKAHYERLIAFVRTSGKFELAATKPLPDQSQMFLYRQK